MAKTPTGEFFATVKSYFNQLTDGERTPTEVASAFNEWARESAESVKAKIAEEVEATVLKMGFIKRDEFDLLLARVAELEKPASKKSAPMAKGASSKKVSQSKPVKKATAKKASK